MLVGVVLSTVVIVEVGVVVGVDDDAADDVTAAGRVDWPARPQCATSMGTLSSGL